MNTMSLDKQKILSELGSVMNQLQSADCGCMGKLFSNSNQVNQGGTMMSAPLPTCGGCRRGWCHGHGYGQNMSNTCEQYSGNTNRPCMGHCNPPKLYADTYNYLNTNLMQPVVQEVYDDLKSITPANTVMNNPMANKMGLGQNVDSNVCNTGMNMIQQHGNQGAGHMSGNMNATPMQSNQQPMSNIGGGMGPEITNLILGDSGPKHGNQHLQGQNSQLTGPMVINAPQSPHGKVGVTPLNPTTGNMYGALNQNQYISNGYQGQGQLSTNLVKEQYQNPVTQYVTEQHSAGDMQNYSPQGYKIQNLGSTLGNMTNPSAQKMATPNQQAYGQHNQGVMKFNEMFPGVTQGGDLGFDPMAIAIQMNPANQQKAAMDAMQKLMNGTPMNKVSAQPAVAQATTNLNQSQTVPMSQNQNSFVTDQLSTIQQAVPLQQQFDNTKGVITPTQPNTVLQQQQEENAAVKESDQKQIYQQPTELQNQGMNNLKLGALQQPHVLESELPVTQQLNREPIFPADTTRNPPLHYTKSQKRYEYNTLGQPVQMLPSQVYHQSEPGLPQTLSPQPVPTKSLNDQMKYSNVKSTVSKTSLIGNGPVERRLSKSQLQHIYNQYKGSQSSTQQNLNSPVQASTYSDGKLNIAQPNVKVQRRIPVEKVGGDTIENNISNNNQINEKVEQVIGQVGDAPCSNNPHGQVDQVKITPPMPARHAKLRNGLQDMVYTSYPTSAAWSFHGANDNRPIPVGYRFREFK